LLTLLFATALLSAPMTPPAPPQSPAPSTARQAARVVGAQERRAVPLRRSPGDTARRAPAGKGLPADAPARARPLRSKLWAPGPARALRAPFFSLRLHAQPLLSVAEAPTPAAAARERFEDARMQLLTSAGLGVAGLLTSGLLRVVGAPLPRVPEVLGLRVAPLNALPLSFSVQGSLP